MSANDRSWDWNSVYWRNLGTPWGGMHTTVGEIFKLLQAMLDNGRGVLKPELALEMITDQNTKLQQPWGWAGNWVRGLCSQVHQPRPSVIMEPQERSAGLIQPES